MVPVCAVSEALMRSIAIMTITTGAKVQRVAFKTESHNTAGATDMLLIGLNTMNCAIQMRQATVVAKSVSRSAPSRFTSPPLYDR